MKNCCNVEYSMFSILHPGNYVVLTLLLCCANFDFAMDDGQFFNDCCILRCLGCRHAFPNEKSLQYHRSSHYNKNTACTNQLSRSVLTSWLPSGSRPTGTIRLSGDHALGFARGADDDQKVSERLFCFSSSSF